MRSRRSSQDQLAEVARRRLELLSAELAEIRPEQPTGRAPQRTRPASGRSRGTGPAQPPVAERPARPADAGRDWRRGRAAGTPTGRSGPAGRLSGWVRDRLPPTLQGGASLSVAHLAVVVAALVAGVLATVWWVSTSDDGGTARCSRSPRRRPRW